MDGNNHDNLANGYMLLLKTLVPDAGAFGCPVASTTRQGRYTIARLIAPDYDNCKYVEALGVAACDPRDEDNPVLGERIAIWRACKALLSADDWV